MPKNMTPAAIAANKKNAQKGGRRPVTAEMQELRALCLAEIPYAHAEVCALAYHGKSEQVRLAACMLIYDRALGRVPQPIVGTGEGGAIPFIVKLPVMINGLAEQKLIEGDVIGS